MSDRSTRFLESEEYQQDRRFLLELFDYLAIGDMAIHVKEGIASVERQGARAARVGMRMALQDLMEMSRDLTPAQVREVDARMAAAGLPTLTVMRERIWQTLTKVLARGRCRTEAEYYLVVERVNDVGDESLPEDDRRRLEAIVADFEQRRAAR